MLTGTMGVPLQRHAEGALLKLVDAAGDRAPAFRETRAG